MNMLSGFDISTWHIQYGGQIMKNSTDPLANRYLRVFGVDDYGYDVCF